jgi:SAM-dependent methyltransferase
MIAPRVDSSFILHPSSFWKSFWSVAACASVVAAACSWGWTQGQITSQVPAPQIKTNPKINEPFRKPDLKGYIKKFESKDREIYVKRHDIVAALGVTKGMTVADVGAGTGLFTRLLAEQVGLTGKVYAVDIAPRFLKHIAAEAEKRGQRQVVTVRCNQETTNLPAESVDLVFLCDVYHHLEKPEKTLASIRQALKPGGELVVIDFDRIEGRSSAFVLKHVRADKAAFRQEIERAGFSQVSTTKSPSLKENFFLRFQKTPSQRKRASDAADHLEPRPSARR